MKIRSYMLICSVLLLSLIPAILPAVSEAGVIFMLIEPGSRPGGMGGAFVAQVDDALATYWNPAGLANNELTQASWMHTNWFGDVDGIDDMYIEYIGLKTYDPDLGHIGLGINYLTYGEQDKTGPNGEALGTFSSYEVAVGLSYGTRITQRINLGTTFKFIFSDLAPEGSGATEEGVKGRGMSWAFDFAMQSRGISLGGLEIDNLDFGVNLQNVGPDITYVDESQADPLPMNLRVGFSYRLLESKLSKLNINADMNKLLANDDNVLTRIFSAWTDDDFGTEIDETIFNIGTEYVYYDLFSIRGGYIHDKAGHIIGPSFGFGMHYEYENKKKIYFDFAFQEAGELTDYNKTFSLGADF